MSAMPDHQDWGHPCVHVEAWNAVTTHTRTSADGYGPDYCAECSKAIQEWVAWPCARSVRHRRWWRYAVLRGEGIPAELNGRWYDLEDMRDEASMLPTFGTTTTLDATNRWEQRDDGEVAVVYEWVRR